MFKGVFINLKDRAYTSKFQVYPLEMTLHILIKIHLVEEGLLFLKAFHFLKVIFSLIKLVQCKAKLCNFWVEDNIHLFI